MKRSNRSPLLILLALMLSGPAVATPDGRGGAGLFLPLQDRVGDPELAARVENALRAELVARHRLVEAPDLRSALRRLRIRDASHESPRQLELLGAELGNEWFFTATLHEAVEEPLPALVLSAKLFTAGAGEIEWAGFAAVTGLDGETWLGRGVITSLEDLVPIAVEDLMARISQEALEPPPRRIQRDAMTFLRAPVSGDGQERVAVVSLDSVTSEAATATAETVGDALFAALDEKGFLVLQPGFVEEILRAGHGMSPGAVSEENWRALASDGAATLVATGTVESYVAGGGERPDPWVAFGVRLVDAETGRIRWMGGHEATGSRIGGAFGRGRIYSAGRLAHEIMRSFQFGLITEKR